MPNNVGRIYGDFDVWFEAAFDPDKIYTDIVRVGRGLCALDTEGVVDCRGELEPGIPIPTLNNPPYVQLSGEALHFCAKRPDHVIECSNGETFDFGPIRDFVAESDGWFIPSDEPFQDRERVNATIDGPVALCVITEHNAIQCHGHRYPQDLLDQLPTGSAG